MSEIDERVDAALEAADAALGKSVHRPKDKKPKKKPTRKQDTHVHQLPDGDLTLATEFGTGHAHEFGDGLVTGPPVSTIEGDHTHRLPDGRQIGPSMPAPSSSAKNALPAEIFGQRLPVLKAPDPAFLVERLRKGETAGLLSRRRQIAKLGDPQVLVDQDGSVQRVYAVVAQGGPVGVSKATGIPGDLSEGVDASTAAAFSGEAEFYYMPLRPLVVFEPPLTLKHPVTKDLDFKTDVVEFDEEGLAAPTVEELVPVELQESRVIQTLIFDKHTFSRERAVQWAKDHDFRIDKVDENDTSIRLRQKDPGRFDGDTLRTIPLTTGIKAVVGVMRVTQSEKMDSGLAAENDPLSDAVIPGRHDLAVERSLRMASHQVIKKAEGEEERMVFGVVLVPDDTDAHGDFYDEITVRNAAHSFMENGGVRKIMHKGEPIEGITVLETYLTRSVETHKVEKADDVEFPVGTWMMAMRINNDEIWDMVLKGEFTGFSMGGTAIREPVADA